MSGQLSRSSVGEYHADELAGVAGLHWRVSVTSARRCRAALLASIRQMSGQLSRSSVGEYQNAIRDLLAVDVDVASLLPSDESSHGFDNVTVGDLPPMLLERYLSAAQKISRLAV